MVGPDKGKQGKVVKVIRAKNRLVVEGVNVVRFSFSFIPLLLQNFLHGPQNYPGAATGPLLFLLQSRCLGFGFLLVTIMVLITQSLCRPKDTLRRVSKIHQKRKWATTKPNHQFTIAM